jgi:hypothetical protein
MFYEHYECSYTKKLVTVKATTTVTTGLSGHDSLELI